VKTIAEVQIQYYVVNLNDAILTTDEKFMKKRGNTTSLVLVDESAREVTSSGGWRPAMTSWHTEFSLLPLGRQSRRWSTRRMYLRSLMGVTADARTKTGRTSLQPGAGGS